MRHQTPEAGNPLSMRVSGFFHVFQHQALPQKRGMCKRYRQLEVLFRNNSISPFGGISPYSAERLESVAQKVDSGGDVVMPMPETTRLGL